MRRLRPTSLHDGAQQRLVSLALQLRLTVGDDGVGATVEPAAEHAALGGQPLQRRASKNVRKPHLSRIARENAAVFPTVSVEATLSRTARMVVGTLIRNASATSRSACPSL
jgi:hypothetical protein